MKNLTYLLAVMLLASCSVVKRNGYYQSIKYKHHSVAKRTKTKKHKEAPKVYFTLDQLEGKRSKNLSTIRLISSHENKVSANFMEVQRIADDIVQHKTTSENPDQDSCDNIILTDGTEIPAKVTEIGINEIKYKRCSQKDGPTIVLAKSDVLMIRYTDGSKDIFPQQASVSENDGKDRRSRRSGLKGLGFVIIIIGVSTFLFVSILIGSVISLFGLILLLFG